MDRIRVKNIPKGQGLLEFALVLPILLLVILGIFAFGHMFFVYTSVVSASREAARYGAVVGVGQGGVPRYQDCAGIRAAAERVGTFAGVTATGTTGVFDGEDPGIYIGYDTGPTTAAYDDCPVGGLGPQLVELGDRILVRVSIDYEPIVPLLDLPSFPLSATTARTIIKDVAVGTAPPAESVCDSAVIDLDMYYYLDPASLPQTPPYELTVGQVVFPNVQLTTSDNNPTPPGTIFIYDREAYLANPQGDPICSFAPPTNSGNSECDLIYPEASVENADGEGGYDIVIDYVPPDPTAYECYMPTTYVAHVDVVPAETEIEILRVIPDPYASGSDVTVDFIVRTNTPGGGQPVGQVKVFTLGGGHRNLDCTFNSPPLADPPDPWDVDFTGSCSLGRNWEPNEVYYINATFTGAEDRYLNSDTSSQFPAPGYPYTIPPEPIDQAQWCRDNEPEDRNFGMTNDSFYFDVVENNGIGFQLTNVTVSWPDPGTSVGVPLLQTVDFGSQIWNSGGNEYWPPAHSIGGISVELLSNTTKTFRASYSPGLVKGEYSATLTFTGRDTNGDLKTCVVTASGRKNN